MSTDDSESLAVNIPKRDRRISRVLDTIHMFEQKTSPMTSPVGSPTSSNQNDRKAYNRSYSYQLPRKSNSPPSTQSTDTMDDSPNKPKPTLPPRNPNQKLIKRPTTVDTNSVTEPPVVNGRERSSHVEINERPTIVAPMPVPPSNRSQLNFVPMPRTPPPKPPGISENPAPSPPHKLPTSSSTMDINAKYKEKSLPAPPAMGPPPTRPPPRAPEDEQKTAEVVEMKAAAETSLNSKSSNSKLVYHSEGSSSFDFSKKKDKKEKKDKKLPFGLKLNNKVNTDARIQEYIKSVGMDDLTSSLFNTVMKELNKRDTSFAVKPVVQKDWKEVETDLTSVDPSILKLIALERALAEGFKFEFGRNNIKYSNEIKVEEPERDVFYYRDYFTTKEHLNFIAEPPEEDKGVSAICISVDAPAEKASEKKCILRTKKGNDRVFLPAEGTGSEKEIIKHIKSNFPECSKSKFVKITDPEFVTTLTTMETKSIALRYKFGVLYVTEGQTDENDMFSNNVTSPDYDEFLQFLGEKITLQGWSNYRGGLDVKNNTTGTHSVYTKHRGYELMYHVATLLPYQPDDLQRVERKRHLGNDIVVIIFKEGDQPFDPLCLTTHFNHVFCVVEKDKSRTDKTFYKVAIANKIGVPPYGPYFKSPPIYEKTEEFRDFLLTKLINAERASIEWAPEFRGKMVRTRKQILEDMAKDWIEKQKAAGKRSFLGKGLGGTMEFLTSDD